MAASIASPRSSTPALLRTPLVQCPLPMSPAMITTLGLQATVPAISRRSDSWFFRKFSGFRETTPPSELCQSAALTIVQGASAETD